MSIHTLYYLSITIFALAYLLITLENLHGIHKSVIAITGASLVLVFHILTQHEAFYTEEYGIDWNVIILLISMMVIVNVMKGTGIFKYLAVKCAKIGKGDPFRIMALFCLVTALVSALIDNVTTVLLISPVVFYVASELEQDPVPFLISVALASNIGGTATLIGDPPNIMIASKAGLTFMDFIDHLTPAVIIMMVIFILMIKVYYSRKMHVREECKKKIMALDEKGMITNPGLAKKSFVVLAATVALFVIHDKLGLQPGIIAFLGASLLLFISAGSRVHSYLAEVEWTSIFFFMGLFIIIGGLVKTGFIRNIATMVMHTTKGNIPTTSYVILWFSGVASAIVDNIPYVATMNPLIIDLARQLWPNTPSPEIAHQAQLLPVWWSLSLGACLGGNGTAIGASANVVICGISEKHGKKISFWRFFFYAFPVWLMTLIVSHLYIWLRYFAFR